MVIARIIRGIDGGWAVAGLATVIGLAAAVPAIVLLRYLDRREPEEGSLLLIAFLWGALAATGIAVVLNGFFGELVVAQFNETAGLVDTSRFGYELLDIDLPGLLAQHTAAGVAATITVSPLTSAFGVVDIDGELVTGFREAPRLPYWVNCGFYVLNEEAIARLPEQGDHERSTFPELAEEGRLGAFRHDGVWLTVNTPKDLRVAEEHVTANPSWLRST